MNKYKFQFLICSCKSHALLVEKFTDEESVYLSIFERGLRGRILPWTERIRWCWQILTKGSPWSDSVILDNEEKKRLRKFLS